MLRITQREQVTDERQRVHRLPARAVMPKHSLWPELVDKGQDLDGVNLEGQQEPAERADQPRA